MPRLSQTDLAKRNARKKATSLDALDAETCSICGERAFGLVLQTGSLTTCFGCVDFALEMWHSFPPSMPQPVVRALAGFFPRQKQKESDT